MHFPHKAFFYWPSGRGLVRLVVKTPEIVRIYFPQVHALAIQASGSIAILAKRGI